MSINTTATVNATVSQSEFTNGKLIAGHEASYRVVPTLNLKHVAPAASQAVITAADSTQIQLETPRSKALISETLRTHVMNVDQETCEPGAEDPFFVCDLGKVERLYQIWKDALPRVHPYYAVKCNNDEEVLKKLAAMGVNFDCASKGEIETVLNLGVDPSRIIYANPCKVASFLRFASNSNVNLTTFDNSEELYKIKKYHPETGVLLRIITDDESAQCRLSTKFGAPLANVRNLLSIAKTLNLNVRGVSFHVGSGASDNDSLIKAVQDAKNVFEIGKELGLTGMDTLDVGGGFSYESFGTASKALGYALDEYFPASSGVNLIAEPGRYFVANAFTLAVNVIAKRGGVFESTGGDDQDRAMVYVNDGVYGNMNCILFDHQSPKAAVLTNRSQFLYNEDQSQGTHKVSIWGPTCDGLDCIAKEAQLSHNVQVGDWLYFADLGAYTSAAASPFNGFKAKANTLYVNSEN
ncbi:hypothetical protein WICPIJ_009897 [Wickerhamomyces pijperi]|uniref:Ornithine decarboxylase n=1 Tax=Wickerhamomyces pijperi TaxID=599730 RepID=A0A9P8PKM5_WICPI|nr:hypothetical protein WICPIJ_009897 [Wickerhamomyces pijperi]